MTSADPADSLDAIGPHTVEVGPWRQRLTRFQRIAGGFMIFKGLTHWASLIGIAGEQFQHQPVDTQAVTVFFAVIDLVAGVALWLGSTWGAMLWLLAAGLQFVADVVVLELSGFMILLTLVEVLLVAGYVIIRFMVHVESGKRK